MKNVYLIKYPRADRSKVGFHRLYFTPVENIKIIEEMFEYSLVLPFTSDSQHAETYRLGDVFRSEVLNRSEKTSTRVHAPLAHNSRWLAFSPLRGLHPEAALKFPYLFAIPRDPRKQQALSFYKEGLPVFAYLQTPKGPVRPICMACPRYILHQAGRCSLGDPECKSSLGVKNGLYSLGD